VTFNEAPHVVGQLYGVPHEILRVYNTILYENVFQNPELFRTQVSLSIPSNAIYTKVAVVRESHKLFLSLTEEFA
jgi:hypothetical protein